MSKGAFEHPPQHITYDGISIDDSSSVADLEEWIGMSSIEEMEYYSVPFTQG